MPLGSLPTATVAGADRFDRSMTDTVSSKVLVTHARAPEVSTTTPCGPDPVLAVPRTVIASVSITDIVFPGGLSELP